MTGVYTVREKLPMQLRRVSCVTNGFFDVKLPVKYKGSNFWNQLPNDLKLITFLNSFKSKLKLTLATFNKYFKKIGNVQLFYFPLRFCNSCFVHILVYTFCLNLSLLLFVVVVIVIIIIIIIINHYCL